MVRVLGNGARRGRKMGWIGWILLALAVLALGVFGLWRWAMATQSVALLDRVDALFTASVAEVSEPVAFGTAPAQVLLVAKPASATGPLPVVVFIHGGSWSHGKAGEYGFVARNLSARGYVGVSAGYRLVPGGEYPAMLEDGAAAVRWVRDNIARYGGDPDRIVLMGHSAGAYNAVMLALDPQWLAAAGVPATSIRGAIGLAGPYDFLPLDSEGTINAFGKAPDLAKTQPIGFIRKDAPPLLLITGDADKTVRPRNSKVLAKALSDLGIPTDPVLVPDMGHVGILLALARPFEGDGTVKSAIFDFLARETATARPSDSSGDIQAAAR
ncbi:alpha/beta hydrolase [Erythrobacter sp. SDW2]|uniref:alpha/beta hydrolase n=1 Tax=Erythrobacter sp. SDW2 TaxID=2907154 RepID=UPI001F3A18BB|nr:alpha/beta hydrolase [Erythrobacter sp. SDW2]UIP07241.1 alpha/beta hydrolase [Erythrobacter sp. SDW2]